MHAQGRYSREARAGRDGHLDVDVGRVGVHVCVVWGGAIREMYGEGSRGRGGGHGVLVD